MPLLEEHCAACHEPADRKGGLDLTTYAAAMRGGSSGSVIKPGSAAQSRLFRLVNHDEAPTMPPGGSKLPEPALNVLRAWIDQGATPDGSTVAPREPATMPQAATAKAPAMEASNAPDAAPAWPDAGSLQPTEGRPSVLRALATSPAAPLAATNGRPGEIHLHDLKTGALLGAWPFPQGRVEDLSFSRDGRRLLAIGGMPGRRGAGLVFDVTTGRLERTFGRFFDSALAGAVSPRQTLIAVAGASKVAQVFDRETGAARFAIEGHEDWITSIAISPDGNWIATGDRQGRILVHEADSGLLAHRYEGHPATIHALRYSPDAKALYSAGGDGRIVAWQADEPERLREFNVGSGAVLDLCLDADGAVLAATSVGGALTFFEAGGRALGRPLALDDDGHAIAFDAHSGQWLIAAHSGHLHRVDARTRRLVPPTATP